MPREHKPGSTLAGAAQSAPVPGPGWIISDNDDLAGRIAELLVALLGPPRRLRPAQVDEAVEPAVVGWLMNQTPKPALIALDLDHEMERGRRIIRLLRRTRLMAPIIVFTTEFSREFGTMIIPEGIGYSFSQEFSREELWSVAVSLLHAAAPVRGARPGAIDTTHGNETNSF